MTLYLGIGAFLSCAAIYGAHSNKAPGNPFPYALATLFFWPVVIGRELYIIHRFLRDRKNSAGKEIDDGEE